LSLWLVLHRKRIKMEEYRCCAHCQENYRGIAINSCIGKLFNTVLNNRLDKYLIYNNLINKCQIGFSKKARTSDHIFVLKTLIGKYINRKGGNYLHVL
jgi:hypothetical protein